MSEATFDTARAEAFRGRIGETLNGAALALAISLGHRAGLFDVMARMAPAPSAAIAEQAGLVERHVRAWLGAVVAGGVVEHDAASDRYRLPPEHAAALTRAARPHNLAGACQWIAALGAAEEHLLECFERGGDVPESAYPRLPALVAETREAAATAPWPLGAFLYTVSCLHCASPALAAGGSVLAVRE
jgi:hypothetical protein